MASPSAPGLLRRDDPRLAPTADLATARAVLLAYRPADPAQRAFRQQLLEWIARHPDDAHRRSCLAGHLTASAIVVDPGRTRVLLTHHRKLDKWLQLGGHCDGDANLPAVALREAEEESGLADLAILSSPIDLDVHVIPARPGEPEHLHLDTRFVVVAPAALAPVGNERESKELRWLSVDEALTLAGDASVERLVRIVVGVDVAGASAQSVSR